MECQLFRKLVIILFILVQGLTGEFVVNTTTSSHLNHHREKRFLSWPLGSGGVCKIVFGFLVPVDVGVGRSFGWAINLQAQYLLSPNLIYWAPNFKPKTKRSISNEITDEKNIPKLENRVRDTTQQYVFQMLETVWTRGKKFNGRECLLRAICEVAESSLTHNGMFGEIIDRILTPMDKRLNKIYFDAHIAGKWGADCLSLYSKCPHGHGFFDGVTLEY